MIFKVSIKIKPTLLTFSRNTPVRQWHCLSVLYYICDAWGRNSNDCVEEKWMKKFKSLWYFRKLTVISLKSWCSNISYNITLGYFTSGDLQYLRLISNSSHEQSWIVILNVLCVFWDNTAVSISVWASLQLAFLSLPFASINISLSCIKHNHDIRSNTVIYIYICNTL